MTNEELEAALRLADEAERVAAKATGGPWFQWTAGGDVSSSPEDCIIMQTMWTRKTREGYTRATKQGDRDCAFVVHARNKLPEFISTVRGLVERVRELERLETVAKAWIIDRNSLSSYAAAMRYDIEHWTAELLKREEPIRKFCEMHFLEESPNA